jgi:hypothetical protein
VAYPKRAGLDAGTAIDEKAGSEPLSHWWPGHWRSLQSGKPTTQVNHSTAWRSRIEPRFGNLPVRRIKPSHIDDWIADMNQDGVSPTKVIEAVGVLRRVPHQLEGEVAVRIDLAVGLCPHQNSRPLLCLEDVESVH